MSQLMAIQDAVHKVKERMHEICPTRAVRLMAVTKFRDRDEALAAIRGGADLLGENRVQEALKKWKDHKPPVPLHWIGHAQTNKVKYGIEIFDSIDSVDSDRLSDALDQKSDHRLSVMVEVNVGEEATKSGFSPMAVLPFLEGAERFSRIRIQGLMTVLPARRENSIEEGRRIRQHMQDMVNLWRMCRSEGFPWAPLDDLSMGMSGDWEWALEAGTTIIRLGTVIFGPRPTK